MEKLNLTETKQFYETAENVWSNSYWYNYSYNFIWNYLHKSPITKCNYILNAGSAGNSYDLNCKMHHMDIAENKVNNCTEYTIGSIESIPFDENYFDGAICVGSVINYTDAIASISELIRVVNTDGIIILEFENSNSLEYLFTKEHKKDASIISTDYLGKDQKQWIYSYNYIMNIIESYNSIKILDVTGFHIIDSLFAKHEFIAEKFNKFDKVLNRHIVTKKLSGNIIVTLKKL